MSIDGKNTKKTGLDFVKITYFPCKLYLINSRRKLILFFENVNFSKKNVQKRFFITKEINLRIFAKNNLRNASFSLFVDGWILYFISPKKTCVRQLDKKNDGCHLIKKKKEKRKKEERKGKEGVCRQPRGPHAHVSW